MLPVCLLGPIACAAMLTSLPPDERTLSERVLEPERRGFAVVVRPRTYVEWLLAWKTALEPRREPDPVMRQGPLFE
jgi:hypothetical protein